MEIFRYEVQGILKFEWVLSLEIQFNSITKDDFERKNKLGNKFTLETMAQATLVFMNILLRKEK
jgi:hypothetical protein